MKLKNIVFISVLIGLTALPIVAQCTENMLPLSVQSELGSPLKQLGTGTYSRYGFSVYHITLWSTSDVWDKTKPYALELQYVRSLSKSTLVDGITDDIRDEGTTDEKTLARWKSTLVNVLPAVDDGDSIVSLAIPNNKSMLFYNGTKLAVIDDPEFIHAFFDLWLGEHADEDLREKLLKHKS